MAGPWEKYQQQPSEITATPLPRNPYEVRRDERDDYREERDFNVDREDTAFDRAKKLRDEYRQSEGVVTYEAALGTFNAAQNTANSSQGDQSLITAYAKMLDPNSAVREGEFATTASTERMIDQLKAKLSKELGWKEGGMITPEGRAAIREEMRNLVVSRFQPAYERQRSYYSQLAGEYGIPTNEVVIDSIESQFPEGMLDPPKVEENLSVATGSTAASELPQEYQNAHYAYLQQNWNNVDPADYERFRMALDERYGQTPDPEAYRTFASTANEFAAQGGRPAELGAVPSPTSEMGWMEGQLNSAAQSGTGAFLANSGNAAAFGLPARLTGNQERLEDIRDINPGASFMGEMTGGIAGTGAAGAGLRAGANALGQGTRAANIISNPTFANAAFGTTYGATQDDNALRGAATGLGASFAGDLLGRQLGKAFPTTFNRSGYRAADESVPSVDDLQSQASDLYRQAEATGITSTPEATNEMIANAAAILRREGALTPRDNITAGTDVSNAMRMLNDFSDTPMTPTQAGSVRKLLGEGRTAMKDGAPDRNQRRIAGDMLEEFDAWAEPALPGVEDARKVAQRAILGREMGTANELATGPRAAQFTQSGEENALRSVYRGLDTQQVKGRNSYPEALTSKIEEVSRGTPFSNAMRALGKFAPTSAVASMPAIGASGVGSMIAGPAGLAAGAGLAGAGLFGRKVATGATQRAAKEAELIARGADDYIKLLEAARKQAELRGGMLGSGVSVAPASNTTR